MVDQPSFGLMLGLKQWVLFVISLLLLLILIYYLCSVDDTYHSGMWTRECLASLLPTDVIDVVLSMMPPSNEAPPDILTWKGSASSNFTLSSAVQFLQDNSDPADQTSLDSCWNSLWKWKGPIRAKTCLWLALHGRLLTNSQRMLRNLSNTAVCSRCNSGMDTVLHALRDCPIVKRHWQRLLPHQVCNSFFSLNLHNWLLVNLRNKIPYDGKIAWSLLFGIAVWRMWNDRNNEVVAGGVRQRDMYKCCFTIATNFLSANSLVNRFTTKQNPSCVTNKMLTSRFRISVDGAVSFPRRASAVGIIVRDHSGFAIKGKNVRLGFLSPLITELQAILSALNMIVEERWSQVLIESDSRLAVDICTTEDRWRGHHQVLVMEIRRLIRETNSSLCHISRDDNLCADWVAKNGLSQPFGAHDFIYFPSALMKLLYFDKVQRCNYGIPPPQARTSNNI